MTSRWLVSAALVGAVHASFSIYWALGGRWLLRTVGPWAVDLAETRPWQAGAGLMLVAMLKVAAAVVPLLLARGRLGAPRAWRAACLAGGLILVVYGGINTVVAWLVLSGVIAAADGFDRPAMLGHAVLWDPLFLLWGLLLVAGCAKFGALAARPCRACD